MELRWLRCTFPATACPEGTGYVAFWAHTCSLRRQAFDIRSTVLLTPVLVTGLHRTRVQTHNITTARLSGGKAAHQGQVREVPEISQHLHNMRLSCLLAWCFDVSGARTKRKMARCTPDTRLHTHRYRPYQRRSANRRTSAGLRSSSRSLICCLSLRGKDPLHSQGCCVRETNIILKLQIPAARSR